MATEATPSGQRGHTAGAFDIRLIIAVLFAIYGVVLTVVGLVGTSAEDIAKAANLNINLWGGIGMVIFAVLFALWSRLRPLMVPDEPGGSEPPAH